MKPNVKKGLIIIAILGIMMMPVFALSGTVVSVTGKVEVQTATGWEALSTGDEVQSGRVISTGFRSQAIIQIAGSSIVVNQLSRLTLEQLAETNDSHESEVFIDLGSISADVQTSQNKRVGFVVNTPVATASVRGTQFDMSISTLNVNRGLVDYNGKKGKSVSVSGGNSSGIGNKEVAANPFVVKVNTALGSTSIDDDTLFKSPATASFDTATNNVDTATPTASVVIELDLD